MREPLPKMVRVTTAHPCAICSRSSWCLRDPNGLSAICQRVESPKRCGEAGWLHRLDRPLPSFTPEYRDPVKRGDWYPQAVKYANQLRHDDRIALARKLGLPDDGLNCIDLLGSFDDYGALTYTFPERDGKGNIIGINKRWPDGTKKHMHGGRRGITLPNGWDDGDGPLYVVEGPTDTAAMLAAGLKAIGRPSNVGGVAFLGEAIKAKIDPARKIVIVGENDAKEDGLWPGLVGAISVAGGVQQAIWREVFWTLAPLEYKDVREYLTSERFEGIPWPERGSLLEMSMAYRMYPAAYCPTGYQSAVAEAKKTVDFNPDKWQY